jgi:hypothetical protein
MANNNSSTQSGGIGFFGLLTIVFITLKLTGHITWSWLWVLAPLWGPLVFVLLFLLIILVFAAIFSKN